MMIFRGQRWIGLFVANFLAVLNDNFVKNLACFVSILWIAQKQQATVTALAMGSLMIPYILFSPLAGRMAKTMSKQRIVVWMKFAEIPIAVVASAGFFMHSVPVVLTAIFLTGLQSAIFSPSKYGLIRDIGGMDSISFGIGTIEMLTFAGAQVATIMAGLFADHFDAFWFAIIVMSIAVIGWLSSLLIKATEEEPVKNCTDTINPVLFIINNFRWAKKIKALNTVVFSLSAFWFTAALLQVTLIRYCPNTLHMTNTQTGIVIAISTVGIGLGCYLAGVLSLHKIELGFVTLGAAGLSIFITLVYLLQPEGIMFMIMISFAALFAGFYKVPLTAWIQQQVQGRQLGEILAYCNQLDFIFIILSAIALGLVESLFGTHHLFLVIAVMSWLMLIETAFLIPGVFRRFITMWRPNR